METGRATRSEASAGASGESLRGDSLDALLGNSVVVLDFETTGLNPWRARIIEVAAIRLANGKRDDFVSLVRPATAVRVPRTVLSKTGISSEMLAGAPSSRVVFGRLSELLFDHPVIVGHNVGFDLGFLSAELSRHRIDAWRGRSLCTLGLASALACRRGREQPPRYPWCGFSLAAVCTALGIQSETFHRAYADVLATEQVALQLIPRARVAGVPLLSGPRTVGVGRGRLQR